MHPKTLRRYFDRFAGAHGDVRVVEEDIVVILDALYFGRGDGTLLCRTPERPLCWKAIRTERIEDYAFLVETAQAMGRRIRAAVIDGRRGVKQMLLSRGIAVQMCQFHQIATVKAYLPAKAKTEAARALRAITLRLSGSSALQFSTALAVWHVLYGDFLREKTHGTANQRSWQYTHKRLRSAYHSLARNLDCLFTFERLPHLRIPNTTNHCDGLFAHIREKVSLHRGLSKARRKKMIDYLLERR